MELPRRRAARTVAGCQRSRLRASSSIDSIATTATVRSLWEEEFLGIREMGGCCVFTMHPQIIGRPGRLAFLDAFIAFVTGHEDVWVTTTAGIAGRV